MASEANVRISLQIRVGSLVYQSQPTSYLADVSVANGPSPGAFKAAIAGTVVQFADLVLPGLCRIMNLDPANFVTVGVYDHDLSLFVPFLDLLPGEQTVLRLSRYMQSERGTGTGVDHSAGNRMMVKADTAPCSVLVEAFDA